MPSQAALRQFFITEGEQGFDLPHLFLCMWNSNKCAAKSAKAVCDAVQYPGVAACRRGNIRHVFA